MNTLDIEYQNLLGLILANGTEKKDRTGTGTISIFGEQIRHNMQEGFPLLTTKKMAIKSIMTELKWFLKGDTNIKYLVDNNCHIWDGDAYKNYLNHTQHEASYTQDEFIDLIKTDNVWAKVWGELGPIYGAQWRMWENEIVTYPGMNYKREPIDQIQNLINELKSNPDSRRLMVSAWNVGEITQMKLPPCHYGFQLYTRELSLDERIDWYNTGSINKSSDYFHEHLDDMGVPRRALSLSWNQRSVDTFLGLPFNIASYGMLLSLIADEVNMVPDELIGNLGDTHLYLNHIEAAKEQLQREPKPHLPKLKLGKTDILNGEFDYEILHYHSHPTIKAPLSN
jgi:thymidylate synthase